MTTPATIPTSSHGKLEVNYEARCGRRAQGRTARVVALDRGRHEVCHVGAEWRARGDCHALRDDAHAPRGKLEALRAEEADARAARRVPEPSTVAHDPTNEKTPATARVLKYRYRDSNPGFRRERAAS